VFTGNSVSDRLDGPCEVLAENDREAMLHHLLEHAGGYRHVEPIDRGVADPYQHFAGTRLRNREVEQNRS
jgi:hypothetical protein